MAVDAVAVLAQHRSAARRSIGAPSSSLLVAALVNSTPVRPWSAAIRSATRSAIGERQMLPQQTKTTLTGSGPRSRLALVACPG